MKNILFVASEVMPFIKTGGLADVVGSLPKCIDKRYFDCRVILPMYSFMNQKWKDMLEYKTHFYMDFNWNSYYVGVMECELDGVHFYFIDNQDFFTCDKPYAGMPYDIGRFAFFSKAALSILPSIEFRPDIIHCHDWQTGLIPVYLNDAFQANEFYRGIKTIMTIHNLKFQGVWDVKTMKDIIGLPDYYFTPDKLEFNRDANMLKGGLVYANAITTVSKTYAEEIKMPYYGEGLDGLMRARQNDLRGIVNGIDYEDWDPKKDPLIAVNYDSDDFKAKKVKNKTALQEELGLNVDPDAMLIGIVSRLTDRMLQDIWEIEEPERFDDILVASGLGRQKEMGLFGYDEYEEDYFGLYPFEYRWAEDESVKRLERLTKKELISQMAQSVAIAFSFIGLENRYGDLKASMDILRAQNKDYLDAVKHINEIYDRVDWEFPYSYHKELEEIDAIAERLPQEAFL